MNRPAGCHAVTPGFMQYSPHPPCYRVSCLYPPPPSFSYMCLLHIPLVRHTSSSVPFPHFFFSLPHPFPTIFCIQVLPFPKAPTQMRPFTKQNQAPSASLLATLTQHRTSSSFTANNKLYSPYLHIHLPPKHELFFKRNSF